MSTLQLEQNLLNNILDSIQLTFTSDTSAFELHIGFGEDLDLEQLQQASEVALQYHSTQRPSAVSVPNFYNAQHLYFGSQTKSYRAASETFEFIRAAFADFLQHMSTKAGALTNNSSETHDPRYGVFRTSELRLTINSDQFDKLVIRFLKEFEARLLDRVSLESVYRSISELLDDNHKQITATQDSTTFKISQFLQLVNQQLSTSPILRKIAESGMDLRLEDVQRYLSTPTASPSKKL